MKNKITKRSLNPTLTHTQGTIVPKQDPCVACFWPQIETKNDANLATRELRTPIKQSKATTILWHSMCNERSIQGSKLKSNRTALFSIKFWLNMLELKLQHEM